MTPIKYGAIRPDGYAFWGYNKKNGKSYECWLKPETYLRCRMSGTICNARKRASQKGLPFDLDIEYLLSIYPADGLCPALGIPMEWGGRLSQSDNSPALDRIVPDRGYVKGNVSFISDKANRIKTNATADEIVRVAKYLREIDYR